MIDSFGIMEFPFNEDITNNAQRRIPSQLLLYPVVYILYCPKTGLAYIGESTNILNRLKQHLQNTDKSKLKHVQIITSLFFHKSAVLDIEANLIQNIQADGKYQLLNGNEGIANHLYYEKERYSEIFSGIWEKLKLEKVVNNDLLSLKNSDLFKYSPYKSLSHSQLGAIAHLMKALNDKDSTSSLIVEGGAGTGKTVLAVYLIKLLISEFDPDEEIDNPELIPIINLCKQYRENLESEEFKVALVIPVASLRSTIQRVFSTIKGLSRKMVLSPIDLANAYKDGIKYDLVIVDEAHRLRRRQGLTNYKSFDDSNRVFGYGEEGDEVDWIQQASKQKIYFYDAKQSIRPSDIARSKFEDLKSKSTIVELKSQLRIRGGEEYIYFVDKLLSASDSLEKYESNGYDFKHFYSIKDLVKALEEKEKEFGLCRLTSGYSWEWVSKSDSTKPDLILEGIDFFWNRTSVDWVSSTTSVTEMGCIHTTQGYDLNYAGIIFGKEIDFNEKTNSIEIIRSNYKDKKGDIKRIPEEEIHEYIVNIYNTLMCRGILGTYIYCYNTGLREYFKKYIPTV